MGKHRIPEGFDLEGVLKPMPWAEPPFPSPGCSTAWRGCFPFPGTPSRAQQLGDALCHREQWVIEAAHVPAAAEPTLLQSCHDGAENKAPD